MLAFGVAVLQEAIKARHDLAAAGIELSPYYLAAEIKAQYAGMMAAHVEPHRLRKHPRGPTKPKKKPMLHTQKSRGT